MNIYEVLGPSFLAVSVVLFWVYRMMVARETFDRILSEGMIRDDAGVCEGVEDSCEAG